MVSFGSFPGRWSTRHKPHQPFSWAAASCPSVPQACQVERTGELWRVTMHLSPTAKGVCWLFLGGKTKNGINSTKDKSPVEFQTQSITLPSLRIRSPCQGPYRLGRSHSGCFRQDVKPYPIHSTWDLNLAIQVMQFWISALQPMNQHLNLMSLQKRDCKPHLEPRISSFCLGFHGVRTVTTKPRNLIIGLDFEPIPPLGNPPGTWTNKRC